MNFPYLVGWFQAVEKLPVNTHIALKAIVGAVFGALMCTLVVGGVVDVGVLADWWYYNVYSLSKYPFNAAHPYWMWIPITAFVYFR